MIREFNLGEPTSPPRKGQLYSDTVADSDRCRGAKGRGFPHI